MVKQKDNKKLKSKNVIKANFGNKAVNNVESLAKKSPGKENKNKFQASEKISMNNDLQNAGKKFNEQCEQISNLCLKNFDYASQNNEFATQIFSNYVANLNLISNDMWNACATYSTKLIECKNIDDFNQTNMHGTELLANILRQMNMVNAQTYLDCCNEIIAPSLKQFAAAAEKLSKNCCVF